MFCFSNCNLKQSNVFLLPRDWNQTFLSSLFPTPKITPNQLWILLGLHSVRMIRQEWENSIQRYLPVSPKDSWLSVKMKRDLCTDLSLPFRARKQIVQRNSTNFNLTDTNYFLCFCEKLQNKKRNLKQICLFNEWIFFLSCMPLLISMQQ